MIAGRSVVRDDATAAVPSSQWRPLDAEEPDELPRGLGIFSRRKSGLTNLQRGTVNTSHHHTDSRFQKPRSARLDAPHPPGFVRAYSEYVSRGAHKETAVKETATTRRHRPSLAASPQSRPRAHSRAHQWRSGAAQPPSASAAAPSPAPAVPVWKRAPAVHSLPFSHSNILLPDTPRTSARAVMSERLAAACCVVSRPTAVRRRRRHRRRSPSPSPPPPLPRDARHLHLPPHPMQTSRARTSRHEERDLERRDLPVRIWPHLDLTAQEEGFVKKLNGFRRLARRREEDGAAAARPPVRVHHDVSMDDIASRAEVVLEGLPSEAMSGDQRQSAAIRVVREGLPSEAMSCKHAQSWSIRGKQALTCHATSQGRFPTNTWQPLPPPSPLP